MTEPTDLLPHRPPMLLLEKVLHVDGHSSSASTTIRPHSIFYIGNQGVPGWVGLEYMGQTAALIAGYQQNQGTLAAHTGFFLGCRQFSTHAPWFRSGSVLTITCRQIALVGETLANFNCEISACYSISRRTAEEEVTGKPLASAVISVFRRPDNAAAAVTGGGGPQWNG